LFKNGVVFHGIWCFSVSNESEKDSCEIFGDSGTIAFTFFNQREVVMTINGRKQTFTFDTLQHVQQPMIERVVEYFLDEGPNPCSGEEGLVVMKLIDKFTSKSDNAF
jgi:predicted dehydrogenase